MGGFNIIELSVISQNTALIQVKPCQNTNRIFHFGRLALKPVRKNDQTRVTSTTVKRNSEEDECVSSDINLL